MDAKSLAKSKRAHSLHNSKKPHPSRKPKPSPAGGSVDGAAASKASGKPVKDKDRATVSALPSNWDRYDEDFDLASEDVSVENASKTSEVVLPKSKGADYRHLLAEAQSQPHSSGYLDSSFSLEDVLPDEFKQTFGAMLSARGEGILSWILDDNFIVEEESGATSSQQASFLSLNFQALEEQLAKVDISKRLFIEPDILPPDLCDDGSHASFSQGSSTQGSESAVSTSMPEHTSHGDKILNQDAGLVSEESTAHDHFKPIFSQGSQTSSPFKSDLAGEKFNHHVPLESQSNFIHRSTTDSLNKLDTFEAATAEAELDKLLDSFGDSNLDDHPASISGTFLPVSMEGPTVLPPATTSAPYQSHMASIDGSIDDMLDSLLEETSTALNHNRSHQQTILSNQLPPDVESSSSRAIPKSTALDDFGSWLDTI